MLPWTLIVATGLCHGTLYRDDADLVISRDRCPQLTLESCESAYLEIAGEPREIDSCLAIDGWFILEIGD